MVTGDRNGDLKEMVSDLALYHPNPQWQRWARDQVELTKFHSDKIGVTRPVKAPEEVDAMPLPIGEEESLPGPELRLDLPDSVLPEQSESGEADVS
jgi:hypothetical protein